MHQIIAVQFYFRNTNVNSNRSYDIDLIRSLLRFIFKSQQLFLLFPFPLFYHHHHHHHHQYQRFGLFLLFLMLLTMSRHLDTNDIQMLTSINFLDKKIKSIRFFFVDSLQSIGKQDKSLKFQDIFRL